MTTHQPSVHHLDLRIKQMDQLFNSLDPTPFLNKDLDHDAEAFMETWAQGFSSRSKLRITIHLDQMPDEVNPSELITEAVHNYFNYKAKLGLGELKRLLRDGRYSLFIGVGFLTFCLVAAEAVKQLATDTPLTVAKEGLTILGWVALWRPLQIFLYEWWPIARRIRVCKNLGRTSIHVVPATHQPAAAGDRSVLPD